MGTIEDIQKMRGEGKTEGEISASLKQRGLTDEQISNSFSEANIKQAVSTQGEAPLQMMELGAPQAPSVVEYSAPTAPGFEGMQPSMLAQKVEQQTEYAPNYEQQTVGGEYGNYAQQAGTATDQQYAYDAYAQYQPYQEAMSSDLINEIAEQIVSEKLMEIQDKLEKAIDFRTVAEGKINSIDERLRRIEAIIDRLQLSLLQKMGEYVNDVKDIRYELEETQKSFQAMVPQLKKIHSPPREEHQRARP